MADNYWDNYWRERKSRRRFLGGALATGAGASALALVGCGDDDDDGGDSLATPTAGAQATATPVDPLAGAKKGGVYKIDAAGDPPTLDPYGNISFLTKGAAAAHYSRLFMYKAGPGIAYGSVRPTPDAAQSAEASPDGMKWTVKLKPNVKFHNLAPVNGRAMTTEDLKVSWERANSATSTNKPSAAMPVDKVEFPDASTMVFTMSKPSAVFLDVLADSNIFYIMPKEAFATSGGFDPAKMMIGSGPWVWNKYEPSVKWLRDRNPAWHNGGTAGAPFFDQVETSIIPEYANRLAQFLAGNTDSSDVNADDLPSLIKQLPNARIEARTGPTLSFTFFDPEAIASGFAKDPRVRQAISMSYDRDALMELGYNVKKLRDAGLKVETKWHNLVPAGETAWWVDPTGPEMGDAGKYFKYNPTEAKALLSAAGFPSGLETTFQYTANRYGKLFNDIAEAMIAYQTAVGVKSTTDVQDYSSKYITQTFLGNFKGIAFGYETPFPEAGSYLTRFFTDNPTNHSRINDPAMLKIAQDAASEVSEEKRKALFVQAQKLNAEKMFYIPNVAGAGTGWSASQANIRNATEFVTKAYGGYAEVVPFRWKG
ncbi:ABC transporter substrate-binding protein [Candidatus Amarobacter glycogenicus]|uniref:ABC transporter substrate-binding protein n=1 Tax=Candidatus Amarobacter glycogenicus TaxID=3140699 RepID=UPI003136C293|nr:ABC transporter substrate-binding protein [Dehalococcoidia bacterium]